MPERPLKKLNNFELAKRFDDNQSNLGVIMALDHELKFRSAKKHRTLSKQISDRIASLTSVERKRASPPRERTSGGGSAPLVIAKIPGMKMSRLMKLWNNAVRIGKDRQDAALVISAIQQEWRRRGANPPQPDEYFEWPSTTADRGDGRLTADGWVREGVLSYMGYRVGSTNGIASNVRQRILELVFEGELPSVFPPRYLDAWAEPKSAARLKKMAETLAAFTRNGKRKRSAKMLGAVKDWERDLKFLYLNFYIDRFHFSWPQAEI